MKIGDKIPVVLKVVRPVVHGESVMSNDGTVELSNVRGDKFWAAPIGSNHGPYYLVCEDGIESEAQIIRRRALIDLIECGVGA